MSAATTTPADDGSTPILEAFRPSFGADADAFDAARAGLARARTCMWCWNAYATDACEARSGRELPLSVRGRWPLEPRPLVFYNEHESRRLRLPAVDLLVLSDPARRLFEDLHHTYATRSYDDLPLNEELVFLSSCDMRVELVGVIPICLPGVDTARALEELRASLGAAAPRDLDRLLFALVQLRITYERDSLTETEPRWALYTPLTAARVAELVLPRLGVPLTFLLDCDRDGVWSSPGPSGSATMEDWVLSRRPRFVLTPPRRERMSAWTELDAAVQWQSHAVERAPPPRLYERPQSPSSSRARRGLSWTCGKPRAIVAPERSDADALRATVQWLLETRTTAQLLRARGILVDDGAPLRCSDNAHAGDRDFAAHALTAAGLGYVDESGAVIVESPSAPESWRALFTFRGLGEAVCEDFRSTWSRFLNREHGYRTTLGRLDAMVAYLVKAVSAAGIATECSCDGHGSGGMSLSCCGPFHLAWLDALLRRRGSSIAWTFHRRDGDSSGAAVHIDPGAAGRAAMYREVLSIAEELYTDRVAWRRCRQAIARTLVPKEMRALGHEPLVQLFGERLAADPDAPKVRESVR